MTFDKTFFVILASIFGINVCYSIIAPFFPLEFEAKSVPNSLLGYTLSTYAVCFAIFSPIMGA